MLMSGLQVYVTPVHFWRNGVTTKLKSWLFQASTRNCLNCVHNCDDHSSLDFNSAVQYMKHFIYHFTKFSLLKWAFFSRCILLRIQKMSQMKWRSDHRSCDCDLSNRKVSPKNVFGASTGFEPMAAVPHQLSYEDPYVGSRPIYWVDRTRERNETWILCELRTYEWNENESANSVSLTLRAIGLVKVQLGTTSETTLIVCQYF